MNQFQSNVDEEAEKQALEEVASFWDSAGGKLVRRHLDRMRGGSVRRYEPITPENIYQINFLNGQLSVLGELSRPCFGLMSEEEWAKRHGFGF
jgi:hypothetical protein